MKKYQIIYADPPWKYGSGYNQDNNRGFKRLEKHYSTMTINNLKNLNVKDITDKDCACFMWCSEQLLLTKIL